MSSERPRLGELTEVVSLVSKTLTADGAGGATSAETVYASEVWAKVVPLRGTEVKASERVEALRLYVVTVRNRTDVQEGHVMRWGSLDLNIRLVRARGPRDHFLVFEAELGAGS